MCARDGRGQWRAEGGTNGATAPGIQGRGHRKSEIRKIKMLRLDDSSYCDATNTCCMDLIFRDLLFFHTTFYVFKCQ